MIWRGFTGLPEWVFHNGPNAFESALAFTAVAVLIIGALRVGWACNRPALTKIEIWMKRKEISMIY